MVSKPNASLSLDLDNQWSYMKIHGDPGWDTYPSYFNIFIPYILDMLDEMDLRITFFIVGKDAVIDENIPYLRMITDRGHEIGNHSFHHESWLQKYSGEELNKEIENSEHAIHQATGQKPKGFRGPGFSWSKELLEILAEKKYIYDASILPTWIGPFARIYYFWKSDLSREEKKDRGELFGTFKDALRPLKPHHYKLNNNKDILEIPVTTIPLFRIPFHLSYLIYLSGISKMLMIGYLKFAIFMCKLTSTAPNFLLHPLDLIGGDQIKELSFFPGMNISSDRKIRIFKQVIEFLKRDYNLTTMSDYSQSLPSRLKIKQLA